jgi:Fe-S-cluster-containing hydrogenase component 2
VNDMDVPLTKGVVTVDKSICAGCRTCEAVCSLFRSGVCDPELSRIEVRADFLGVNLTAHICFQCIDPLCMEACPVDAISVHETTGARVVDEDLCTGCYSCIEACGSYFDPPRLRSDPANQVVLKCDLCGGDPQCVEFCPTGALTYRFDSAGIRSGHPMEVEEMEVKENV